MSVVSNTDSASARKPSRLHSFFINRNFALLFLGQGVSLLGDQVFVTILLVWVAAQIALRQPWGPLATSGLMIASILPTMLVGPVAGVFVDRWKHRHTMLWMDLLRAGLLAALCLLPLLQGHSDPLIILMLIYVALFCENVCAQFFSPARFALIGDIVPEEKRPQATGMEQVSQALAAILGPPLAAPLLFGVGAQWAFFFDMMTFVVSFCTIWAVRATPSMQQVGREASGTHDGNGRRAGIQAEFMEGLRFVFGKRVIRALVISIFLLTLSIGAFAPLSVFFVQQNLHASVSATGILLAFFGAGGILGAILFGVFAQRIGIRPLFVYSIFLAGILFICFSRLNNFLIACIVVLALGAMQAGLNVASAPILLKETPRNFMGRVSSVIGPVTTAGSLISVLGAGYVSGVLLARLHLQVLGLMFGPVDTVFTISGIIVLLAGAVAAFSLFETKESAQVTRHP
jgi:MFS family permease